MIDTANYSLVGIQGEDIIFMIPPPQRLTRERALNMAAWLVAMADEDGKFAKLLEAVKNT